VCGGVPDGSARMCVSMSIPVVFGGRGCGLPQDICAAIFCEYDIGLADHG